MLGDPPVDRKRLSREAGIHPTELVRAVAVVAVRAAVIPVAAGIAGSDSAAAAAAVPATASFAADRLDICPRPLPRGHICLEDSGSVAHTPSFVGHSRRAKSGPDVGTGSDQAGDRRWRQCGGLE